MKVALCLIGMVGGKDGKYGLNQSLEVLKSGFKQYKKHILDKNDVDIFCHTSSVQFSEDIISLYNPKRYMFLKEPTFNIPSYVTGEQVRKQGHYHMWFSYKTVSHLRQNYEKESGQKYDLVYVGRYDLAWQTDVIFSKLNKNKFYAGYLNRISKKGKDVGNHEWHHLEKELLHNGKLNKSQESKGYASRLVGYPHNDEGLIDRWFISNPKYMDKFCTLFDNLNEYTKPGKFWNIDKVKSSLIDCAGQISNHRLAPAHLEKIGLLDKLDFKFYTHDDFPLVRRLIFKNK